MENKKETTDKALWCRLYLKIIILLIIPYFICKLFINNIEISKYNYSNLVEFINKFDIIIILIIGVISTYFIGKNKYKKEIKFIPLFLIALAFVGVIFAVASLYILHNNLDGKNILDKVTNMIKFCLDEDNNLTSNMGILGDYIGGVTGTIISAISAIFIYMTFQNQNEELKLLKKDAEQKNVFAYFEKFENKIEALLNTKLSGSDQSKEPVEFRYIIYKFKKKTDVNADELQYSIRYLIILMGVFKNKLNDTTIIDNKYLYEYYKQNNKLLSTFIKENKDSDYLKIDVIEIQINDLISDNLDFYIDGNLHGFRPTKKIKGKDKKEILENSHKIKELITKYEELLSEDSKNELYKNKLESWKKLIENK